jgi:hypothetical protein
MKLAAIALALLFAPTSFRSIDLLKAFHAQLPGITKVTRAPVLLPRSLPLAGPEKFHVYTTSSATRTRWDLELAAAPKCGGSNACFIASFQGRQRGHLPRKSNLRLANGDRAYYHPITCGASCTPASLWFVHGGVLYSWQLKEPPTKNTRGVIAALAVQAIKAGPR